MPRGLFPHSHRVAKEVDSLLNDCAISNEFMLGWDASETNEFFVHSFLVVPRFKYHEWVGNKSDILRPSQGRRIKYNKLNDKIRYRALSNFLLRAGELDGFCISIAIDQRIISKLRNSKVPVPDWMDYEWKPRMLGLAGLFADLNNLIVTAPALAEHEAFLIFDRDGVLDNPAQRGDFEKLIRVWYEHTGIRRTSAINVTFDDVQGAEFFTDIADLMAGAVKEVVPVFSGNVESKTAEFPFPNMKPKDADIARWAAWPKKNLKTKIVLIEQMEYSIAGSTIDLSKALYPEN